MMGDMEGMEKQMRDMDREMKKFDMEGMEKMMHMHGDMDGKDMDMMKGMKGRRGERGDDMTSGDKDAVMAAMRERPDEFKGAMRDGMEDMRGDMEAGMADFKKGMFEAFEKMDGMD